MRFAAEFLTGLLAIVSTCAAAMDEIESSPPLRPSHVTGPLPVRSGGRWGYISSQGKVVIPATFDEALDFSDGAAPVRTGAKFGLIDAKGTVLLSPAYRTIRPFSAARAAFNAGNGWGFLDPSGKVAVAPRYDVVGDFNEGIAPVRTKSGWGFIDVHGKDVVTSQFAEVGLFSEGRARVRKDALKWSYIDASGKSVIAGPYERATDFHDGLACAETASAAFFIDLAGKIAFELGESQSRGCREDVSYFAEGLALIALRQYINAELGFVDKTGALVLKHPSPASHLVGPFGDGRAPFYELRDGKERFGYVDRKGAVAIPASFDQAEPFHAGLAKVEVEGNSGYIDPSGKYVWKPAK